jgi:hypothetical protein
MVVVAMAVIVVNCAAAFDAVATIPSLLLMAAATNAIAVPPLTAAAQSTMTIAKAAVDKQGTLAVDGSGQHPHCRH